MVVLCQFRTHHCVFLPRCISSRGRLGWCQNGQFLIILPLNFRPLKMIPGRWKFLCGWANNRIPAGQKTQVCRMDGLDRASLWVRVKLGHFKYFFPVLQLLTHYICQLDLSPTGLHIVLHSYVTRLVGLQSDTSTSTILSRREVKGGE